MKTTKPAKRPVPVTPSKSTGTDLPVTTSAELTRLRMNWPPFFLETYPEEAQAAEDAWELVALGRKPLSLQDRIDLDKLRTSLPGMWAALWRPMRDGRTGIDLALERPRLASAASQTALRRIAQARGVYVECLHVDERARVLTLRDLFTQEVYRVTEIDKPILPKVRRWLRFFGILIELGDGTWNYISSFSASGGLAELSPEAFIREAQAGLALAGYDPAGIDPAAPHEGLRRYCGVAYAAVARWLGAQPDPQAPPTYLHNSDGDRFEHHQGWVRLSQPAATRLQGELAHAAGYVRTGAKSYDLVSRQHTTIFTEGEALASVILDGPRVEINANSARRYADMLARLTQLAGEGAEAVELKIMRPWEVQPGCVAEPGPGVRELVMASAAPMSKAAAQRMSKESLPLSHMRRALDSSNRSLGGVPRQLAATPEGRAAVERWFHEAEVAGLPDQNDEENQMHFLDLDPLRQELGMPTVRQQIVSSRGGRGV